MNTRRIPGGTPRPCDEWVGAVNSSGYGVRKSNGKVVYVHREAYEIANGPIPEGYEVDHLCRNKICREPSHLEAVTPYENKRRRNAAVTHCPQGHEYTDENTSLQLHRDGYMTRKCRTCHREREQARRARGGGCGCECNSGGFCGGCGHAGCGGRR